MSARSIVTLFAAALFASALAGCPSPTTTPMDGQGTGRFASPPSEREDLRDTLAKNRARHIDQLHEYWMAGTFPKNEIEPTITNVFRDSAGHLCAVANMIQRDGGNDRLIDETARTHNTIRLADVHEGPLYDWILTSGFTQEEVAMIQVPYMGPRQTSEETERQRLMERLSAVEARLRDDTPQGLTVAMQRYETAHGEGAVRVATRDGR